MKDGWWALGGAVFAAVAAVALGIAYWLAVVYGRPEMAYAVTLACLAYAVAYLIAGRRSGEAGKLEQLETIIKRGNDLVRALEAQRNPASLAARAELENRPQPAPQPAALAPSGQRQEPVFGAGAGARPAAKPQRASKLPLGDTLDLYLEPVVDLGNQQTVHYHATLGLVSASGERLAHDALFTEADRSGLRPALDVFAVTRCLRVAERMKRNRPELKLFIPIGKATLSDRTSLQAIQREIEPNSRMAQSLAFEIGFDVLGTLDSAGIDGLARLARLGGSLALGQVWDAELDLTALRASRFQYLCFDMAALLAEPNVPPAWEPLALQCVREGFEIIAAHADSPAQAAEARRHARFARGAAFAPPRLVRAEMFEPRRAAAA